MQRNTPLDAINTINIDNHAKRQNRNLAVVTPINPNLSHPNASKRILNKSYDQRLAHSLLLDMVRVNQNNVRNDAQTASSASRKRSWTSRTDTHDAKYQRVLGNQNSASASASSSVSDNSSSMARAGSGAIETKNKTPAPTLEELYSKASKLDRIKNEPTTSAREIRAPRKEVEPLSLNEIANMGPTAKKGRMQFSASTATDRVSAPKCFSLYTSTNPMPATDEGHFPSGSAFCTGAGNIPGISYLLHATTGDSTKQYEPISLDTVANSVRTAVKLAIANAAPDTKLVVGFPLIGGNIFLKRIRLSDQSFQSRSAVPDEQLQEIIANTIMSAAHEAVASSGRDNVKIRCVDHPSNRHPAFRVAHLKANAEVKDTVAVDLGDLMDILATDALQPDTQTALVNPYKTDIVVDGSNAFHSSGGLSGAIAQATRNDGAIQDYITAQFTNIPHAQGAAYKTGGL